MVLIIFSFLIFTGPGDNPFSCNAPSDYGTVFGDEVTRQELVSQMSFNNIFNGDRTLGDSERTRQAFEMLCLSEAARRRGIAVCDSEIGKFIRTLPFFTDDKGRFSAEAYRRRLGAMYITAGDFENGIKGELLRMKLDQTLQLNMICSDDEVQRFCDYIMEEFDLRIRTFSAAEFAAGLSVTDEELKSAFDAAAAAGNPYMIQPRFSGAAVIVDFTSGDYPARAMKTITEADIEALYNRSRDRFTDADGAVKPLSEVKTALLEELVRSAARKIASEDLENFIVEAEPLLSNRETRLEEFRKAAEKAGYTVRETGFYRSGLTPDALAEVPALAEAIARRTTTQPVTETLSSGNCVGAAILLDRENARNARLEEVLDEVRRDVTADKAARMAHAAAGDEAARLEALAATERAAAAEAAGFQSLKLPRQFFLEQPSGAEISTSEPGDITGPVPAGDGYAVWVTAGRRIPDPESSAPIREALISMFRMFKYQNAYGALSEVMAANGCIPPRGFEE